MRSLDTELQLLRRELEQVRERQGRQDELIHGALAALGLVAHRHRGTLRFRVRKTLRMAEIREEIAFHNEHVLKPGKPRKDAHVRPD